MSDTDIEALKEKLAESQNDAANLESELLSLKECEHEMKREIWETLETFEGSAQTPLHEFVDELLDRYNMLQRKVDAL